MFGFRSRFFLDFRWILEALDHQKPCISLKTSFKNQENRMFGKVIEKALEHTPKIEHKLRKKQ